MSNYNIISSEAISNSEVLEFLNKKQEEKELTYREEKSREYLKKFVKRSSEDFNKIIDEIIKLEIPRLDEKNIIIKIIEIMPKNGTELRSIVSNSGTILVDENVTKILDIIKKYQ